MPYKGSEFEQGRTVPTGLRDMAPAADVDQGLPHVLPDQMLGCSAETGIDFFNSMQISQAPLVVYSPQYDSIIPGLHFQDTLHQTDAATSSSNVLEKKLYPIFPFPDQVISGSGAWSMPQIGYPREDAKVIVNDEKKKYRAPELPEDQARAIIYNVYAASGIDLPRGADRMEIKEVKEYLVGQVLALYGMEHDPEFVRIGLLRKVDTSSEQLAARWKRNFNKIVRKVKRRNGYCDVRVKSSTNGTTGFRFYDHIKADRLVAAVSQCGVDTRLLSKNGEGSLVDTMRVDIFPNMKEEGLHIGRVYSGEENVCWLDVNLSGGINLRLDGIETIPSSPFTDTHEEDPIVSVVCTLGLVANGKSVRDLDDNTDERNKIPHISVPVKLTYSSNGTLSVYGMEENDPEALLGRTEENNIRTIAANILAQVVEQHKEPMLHLFGAMLDVNPSMGTHMLQMLYTVDKHTGKVKLMLRDFDGPETAEDWINECKRSYPGKVIHSDVAYQTAKAFDRLIRARITPIINEWRKPHTMKKPPRTCLNTAIENGIRMQRKRILEEGAISRRDLKTFVPELVDYLHTINASSSEVVWSPDLCKTPYYPPGTSTLVSEALARFCRNMEVLDSNIYPLKEYHGIGLNFVRIPSSLNTVLAHVSYYGREFAFVVKEGHIDDLKDIHGSRSDMSETGLYSQQYMPFKHEALLQHIAKLLGKKTVKAQYKYLREGD